MHQDFYYETNSCVFASYIGEYLQSTYKHNATIWLSRRVFFLSKAKNLYIGHAI